MILGLVIGLHRWKLRWVPVGLFSGTVLWLLMIVIWVRVHGLSALLATHLFRFLRSTFFLLIGSHEEGYPHGQQKNE